MAKEMLSVFEGSELKQTRVKMSEKKASKALEAREFNNDLKRLKGHCLTIDDMNNLFQKWSLNTNNAWEHDSEGNTGVNQLEYPQVRGQLQQGQIWKEID